MSVRRALVVCTANVCRSPTAAALLTARISGVLDIERHEWVVTSAGISDVDVAMDPNTVRAASTAGIDMRGHHRRVLDREMLATDGADLVLTMTREHLRAVIGLDLDAWSRTFTLKELARRTLSTAPVAPGEGFAAWRQRISSGRRAGDLMRPDARDDIADPFGAERRAHDEMVSELQYAIDALLASQLWQAA